ncbi:MAG: hypothetical protein OXN25_13840 [Candidatus Poribacteria bacterium]|nr:hypothetical protein [Candidatus Poribacteria bacterium]
MFARSQRKKYGTYVRETSMPTRRLGKHPNAKVYTYRRVIFVVAILLTFAFIARIVLSFFGTEYVSLELSGNVHYTEVQIYDILAEQLDNIVTDSEGQTENYLKENLSYIKEAHVSKHVMKRLFTVEITEREPFVLLRFYEGFKNPPVLGTSVDQDCSFFLLDVDAHVLERIEVGEAGVPVEKRFQGMVMLIAAGDKFPKVGTVVQTSGVPVAVKVLKSAVIQQPELAKQIETIDASRPQQIKMQIETLPLPVWIASDTVEAGLHHVALLLKQHRGRILELLKVPPDATQPYLDARFEDSIYLGGYTQKQ